jgi:hypothetical protein
MIDQKQLKKNEYFSYLGSLIANDVRYSRKIKFKITMAKAAFKKNNLFTIKLDLNLRKKLNKRYIWSRELNGAET